MAHFVTDRIVVGLYRTSGGLLVAGVLSMVGAMVLTSTADALLKAAFVAALAFMVPALGTFALGYWLDSQAERLEERSAGARQPQRDATAKRPFQAPARGYLLAVVAALAAWGLRYAVNDILPNTVPFITFFLAVAVAGWLGGFGPALVATILCAAIAQYVYLGNSSFQPRDIRSAVALGLFILTSLGIGALTAALHSALLRIEVLRRRIAALEADTPDI